MELRELKKEVQGLPDVRQNLQDFHTHWIKPLRGKPSSISLQSTSPQSRKELTKRLLKAQETITSLHEGELITQKLQQYARHLIELKLTTFNGDTQKSKVITHLLLHDKFLSLTQTIAQIKAYNESLAELQQQYQEINEMVHQNVSLEEALYFMELPHARYLQNLIKLGEKQKALVRDLGRHFVSLAKQTKSR
ncbi:hypothetical protein HYU22_05515 [Candidatus Woesearchaeota archaeon]|nr:hypothetical protein [Candidatus Woesearchaeota archaeon]